MVTVAVIDVMKDAKGTFKRRNNITFADIRFAAENQYFFSCVAFDINHFFFAPVSSLYFGSIVLACFYIITLLYRNRSQASPVLY